MKLDKALVRHSFYASGSHRWTCAATFIKTFLCGAVSIAELNPEPLRCQEILLVFRLQVGAHFLVKHIQCLVGALSRRYEALRFSRVRAD